MPASLEIESVCLCPPPQDDVLRRAVALHGAKEWKKIGASPAVAWGPRAGGCRHTGPPGPLAGGRAAAQAAPLGLRIRLP